MDLTPRLLQLAATALLVFPALGADRDFVETSDFVKTVPISWSGTSATVGEIDGITVTRGAQASHLVIQSSEPNVQFVLTGTSTDGYLEINSASPVLVVLDGLQLTSTDGPALSLRNATRNHLLISPGSANSLADSATSSRTGNGALYATGPLIVSGDGSLSVAGSKSHAISTTAYYRSLGGEITVTGAAKDGIHANQYFRMDQGRLSVFSTGDGIDADAGSILVNGGRIAIRSTADDVKGMKCDGPIAIHGGHLSLTVDGAQSKAISTKSDITLRGGATSIHMAGNVFLKTVTDPTTYTDPSYSTALKTDGNVLIENGSLTITHTGLAGKGISTDGNITIAGGTVDVTVTGAQTAAFTNSGGTSTTASADCIKADGALTITGGTVLTRATGISGDCLSSDGPVLISGGTVAVTVAGQAGDGLSSDQDITVRGGNLTFTARGNKTKALKSDGPITLSGGDLTFSLSGALLLETVATGRFDPSYCTAIKGDSHVILSGANIAINHTGQAGKGISADGNLTITGGTISVTTSGTNSSSFTNASGTLDMASADCLKADGNLLITGGTVTAISTGNGGDAISAEGTATFGVSGIADTPTVTARTSGGRILLSGSGNNANYVNPKAIKSQGNLTIHGGSVTASTTQAGGEGIESKAIVAIHGGEVESVAYDDAINGGTQVIVTGGRVYCYSSTNDGIDSNGNTSNGAIRITGGLVISSGSNSPECGFDCDSNPFIITGGTVIGTGGSTSVPSTSASTQRSVLYSGAGTANVILHVTSASGENLVYRIPRTYARGGGGGGGGGGSAGAMSMVFSNAGLTAGTTYTILSGATVTGGNEYRGYITGATVSGGTILKTFTPTTMVTIVQ